MDWIELKGIRCRGIIGAYDFERLQPSTLVVDIKLGCDARSTALYDALDNTIDYALVVQCIRSVVANAKFQLLESLAEALSHAIFKAFPTESILLSIHKPGILPDVMDVALTIERQREGSE